MFKLFYTPRERSSGGYIEITLSVRLSVRLSVQIRVQPITFLGHLSDSGDLLLWVGVRRRPSCVNIFSSETTGLILTKFGM